MVVTFVPTNGFTKLEAILYSNPRREQGLLTSLNFLNPVMKKRLFPGYISK